MDDSANGIYHLIIGRYLLTELWLDLKLSQKLIEAGSTALMVDLGMYDFKNLIIGKITPEESFMNAYA